MVNWGKIFHPRTKENKLASVFISLRITGSGMFCFVFAQKLFIVRHWATSCLSAVRNPGLLIIKMRLLKKQNSNRETNFFFKKSLFWSWTYYMLSPLLTVNSWICICLSCFTCGWLVKNCREDKRGRGDEGETVPMTQPLLSCYHPFHRW